MDIREKLCLIQQEIKAPKNLRNSFGGYMYRNAESILEAFKPFEGKYKVYLTLHDDIVCVGERVYVKATATVWDTEADRAIGVSAFARESGEKKGMDESQITGAASSYARKYALNGLLLLDDTKDADTDEFKQQQKTEMASKAQISTIESICKKHKVDIAMLYASNNLDPDSLTATQAGKLLQSLKVKFGDE